MGDAGRSKPEIPERIETERLVLRCWGESDTLALREAIDTSLEHLVPWLPWAQAEPRTVAETREILRGFEENFRAGEDFVFGVFSRDEAEVVGGCGLHRRIGPGGLEIGYWVRADRTQRGYATETARALTAAALAAPGIDRLQIHCDPRNEGSRRIPVKLGYRLVETRVGEAQETLVFEIGRGPPHRES